MELCFSIVADFKSFTIMNETSYDPILLLWCCWQDISNAAVKRFGRFKSIRTYNIRFESWILFGVWINDRSLTNVESWPSYYLYIPSSRVTNCCTVLDIVKFHVGVIVVSKHIARDLFSLVRCIGSILQKYPAFSETFCALEWVKAERRQLAGSHIM